MKKIAIIGAGAAGLMAAVTAAEAGADVTVFEQNTEAGKKILASGNGRCNIINRESGPEDFSGEDPSFCTYALDTMPFSVFEKFCRRIGLLLQTKSDGKCYPLSNEAKSVQSALIRAARHRGVTIRCGSRTDALLPAEKGLTVVTEGEKNRFDAVILAAGSPAAPQLGGSGSGLAVAEALGHRIVPPFPSLVGLHLDHPALPKMAGVKIPAALTLLIDNAPAEVQTGDLLFTRYGASGFAVLDLSYTASKALQEFATVTLQADLLPDYHIQSLASHIGQMAKNLPDDTAYDLLCGVLPRKLNTVLLKEVGIDEALPCPRLSAKQIKRLVYTLKQWRFAVTDTHGYPHAEVAGGGVSTAEIDPKTMQSLKVPGLYFAGEMIDITGRRGGFNFHFAWASGYIAGKSAAENSGRG